MSEKKKILVVDDESDIQKWLKILFENNGYEVITACDGMDGIEKANSDRPDLVTLDITMPKESGVKMYRQLCESESLHKVPVIILTGVSAEFERFISTRKQVPPPAAYFEKPVDKNELLGKVAELLG